MEHYQTLMEYISNSPNGILVTLIAVIAGLLVNLYRLVLNNRKDEREHERVKELEIKRHHAEQHDRFVERERENRNEIMAVVKENTAAITANTAMCAGLKILFESMSADLKTALAVMSSDSKDSFARIHNRLDELLGDTRELKTTIKTRNEK